LFQNPVGFETSSWKNRQKPGFSSKSKEAVPKAEVLGKPPYTKDLYFVITELVPKPGWCEPSVR
jgi:hypothetical protein